MPCISQHGVRTSLSEEREIWSHLHGFPDSFSCVSGPVALPLSLGPRSKSVYLLEKSEEPLALPPDIVNIHSQFNKMEKHLGDSPLNMSERDFLLYHNEGKKAHRECGQH